MTEYDVDRATIERLGALCLALPEVVEETAWVGARWRVRGKTFAHVLPVVDAKPASYAEAAGITGPATVLTFRVTAEERVLFQRLGPPYFSVRWGRDVGGLVLGSDPDWDEIAELVTESYRLMAPRRLASRLETGTISGQRRSLAE